MDQQASSPAVRFEHVSKRYPLNSDRNRSLFDLAQRLVGRRASREFFWPLKDVSFDLPAGRTVGIIGENGAGKSTLLKLIPRIVEPTEGAVIVNGRVSALLELGAGFHLELTGRENIYLNGSVLGLRRAKMERLYDQIVRFADIGQFIDTPVKNYSSGMYARLGFAIAISVDPDVLLVDEVLAVGDEEFQRRCIDAIRRLQAAGKTIIIVSHSLTQVADLCNHAIWLHDNHVEATGESDSVVKSYVRWVEAETARKLLEDNTSVPYADEGGPTAGLRPRRWGKGPLSIKRVQMYGRDNNPAWSFDPLEPVAIELEYEAESPIVQPVFSVLIHKTDGRYLWASNTVDHPVGPILAAGTGRLRVQVQGLALTVGRYHLSAAAYTYPDPPYWPQPSDFHDWMYRFQVVSGREVHGDVVMPSHWEHEPPAGYGQTERVMAGGSRPA